jgi:hypothetical protein
MAVGSMSHQIWYADSEVFAHDNLWVFKRQSDGGVESFWNDPDGVREFIAALNPVLVGYNIAHYDSYILKATLLGWEPEDVHHVSHTIIHEDDRSLTWALFNGQWVDLPPIIDLFHDISPRKGLKDLEAMMGLSIVESSVSFDIDRPLTEAERDEVLRYCISDVDATAALYDLRFNYLKSKSNLCEASGIDPLTMLKHTNARIVSEVLHAERTPRVPDETYEIPENIDQSAIPQSVIDYALQWNTDNCTPKTKPPSVEFMFHDCPTTFGLGGIHASVPSYKESANDERAILIQDIGSFYPSLIINNGYMSRAVPDAGAYKDFYDMRMAAKASGDTATADAAKLVLNTTYGAMKDTYNKLFDPMQATRVCLSGQLYILDLIEQLYRAVPEGLTLIQLNTDGWVISIPRDTLDTINDVVSHWQERTGFTVDTDEVETIVQANVNNYALRKTNGKVKAKGGVVACYAGADLFYQMPQIIRNNNTIIDKAVVDYLLDGIEIETTVADCDDIERFQIVAKAGRTFAKVVHQSMADNQYDMMDEVEVQRCNRVYATTLTDVYGGIFKVKMEDGKETGRSKIPLTPEHCVIDNDNSLRDSGKLLTMLDKSWYVTLAKQKAKEFITRDKKEREQMSDVAEQTNELQTEATEQKPPTPRRKSKKTEGAPAEVVIPTFPEKLLALQREMAVVSTGVEFDKVVNNINHEYADTQQYKKWLSAKCTQLGLIFKLDVKCEFLGVITPEGKTPSYGAQADGWVTLRDANDFDKAETYAGSGFGMNVQAGFCNGAAQTNLLRNFILNNYLLDNSGREGDDTKFNSGETTITSNGIGYTSSAEKTAIKSGIADAKAEQKKYATPMYVAAVRDTILAAQEVKPAWKAKTLAKYFNEDGSPKTHKVGDMEVSTWLKEKAVATHTRAEEIVAAGVEKVEA